MISSALALVVGCKQAPPEPEPVPDAVADGATPEPLVEPDLVPTPADVPGEGPQGEDFVPPMIGVASTKPPPALELPTSAPIIVHLDKPSSTLEGLEFYVPELPDARTLVDTLVNGVEGGRIGTAIVAAIDYDAPWDIAIADGELIVHVPLVRGRMRSLGVVLAGLPAAGTFGAVDLQRGTAPGPKLAWLDRAAPSLTLADTEPGLATGRELAAAYGKQPMRVDVDGKEVRKYVPDFRFDRLTVVGEGPHAFEATASGVAPEIFEPLDVLQPGALTGLLETEKIAVGVSSKYRDYKDKVKELSGRIKSELERQAKVGSLPSQVRGTVRANLDDFHKRLSKVLAHWNGRTMLGVGPKNRMLLGLGAKEPKKMRADLVSLISDVDRKIKSVESVISTARAFGVSIPKVALPKIRFDPESSTVVGLPIAVLVLEQASKYLPPEFAPLIDGSDELRVAMAFSNRAGAGLIVVGVRAEHVLGPWLEETSKKTAAKDSTDHFLALTVAIDKAQLQPVLEQGADPFTLLGLDANRDPTLAVVTRDGSNVTVAVKGPAPK